MAASPPSPVLGAFDDRNLARSGALSYGPPALGGGQAPPKDILRTRAQGRFLTPSHPTPDAVRFETPLARDTPYTPRTGSSVATVTGTLSFGDTFSAPSASGVRGSVRGVVCGSHQETTDALDVEFDISYLVPKVDGGYFGEILIAVPKQRGDSERSVFNNTWFRFPTPKSDEVDLIIDRKSLRRNAGDDDSDIWTRRYSVPACGNIPAVPLCTQKKLWLNRYAVVKLIEGGFLRGPQNMWLSKDQEYIQRVHRLVSATVDAVRLDSFDNQIAHQLYIIDEVPPTSRDDVGIMRPKRRSPITQHAKHLVENFNLLCGLLTTLSIVLTYGKKASIATQMQRQYDVKQAAEQDVVCDQLLDAMRMGKQTMAAVAFKKSLPPPLRQPMSMDDFETAMNKALRQLTRGAGAREQGDEEGGPQVAGPDVSARTWGIPFTLTHLFQAAHVVGGGDSKMCDAGIAEATVAAEPKTSDHHRWIVRQLLESVMQDAHPRLTFVMGPCLRAFSHLHGVSHRILDIW